MKIFQKIYAYLSRKQPAIIIVSGLPRSGTSLMMKMLEAGGHVILTDGIRIADTDNPKGYYEFERAKQLVNGDTDWLPEARGKVVKIISALLPHLPDTYSYKILFMERDLDEVLASQKKMLIRRGHPAQATGDSEMKQLYQDHLNQIFRFLLEKSEKIKVQRINYNALLNSPLEQLGQVRNFLGEPLDLQVMRRVIDPELYRNR